MDAVTVPVIDMAWPEGQAAPKVRDACLKHGFFFGEAKSTWLKTGNALPQTTR